MSAVVSLRGLGRRFGVYEAVSDVSLDLEEGEFFALLGPSGCGKTTLLRMIAGFESPTSGRIALDGADMTSLPPHRRPVNLMFQSYALFPHMSVRANVAYGLEMERLPRAEIARRVDEILETAELTALATRRPAELSGGQRQRVALARALVKRPRVLLLDEPLAALDARLRGQMQLELKRLQGELGITFVVVTHDQQEALVMADRIALMNAGRIEQVASPRELYEHPATRFAARFIGATNLFEGHGAPGGVAVEGLGLLPAADAPLGLPCALSLRPERLRLGPGALSGTVAQIAYHGQDLGLHVALPGQAQALLVRLPAGAPEAASLAPGQIVSCTWAPEDARVLTA
ncbi:ABC transporter ATP-binding protein [Oceanicella sp. SM1341]|uniref:ABC transporter ATP-binding protein n=1 Tax=Oceanicella sp. SM1341 TaxID=1548889 RepID=UPI0018E54B26|nr:ABC transporter ATP-binding protein [Oceanicella sp. SM1341]